MKRFRNRTIALFLASAVVVAGAFGAENYKNTIKSIKFKTDESGSVNMTMFTQSNYTGGLNLIKRDASTYIIMLPDIKSDMLKEPKLSSNVQSVDIKTMPYTPTGNGYTKITVKTNPNVKLSAKSAIYVEKPPQKAELADKQKTKKIRKRQPSKKRVEKSSPEVETITENEASEVLINDENAVEHAHV